MVPIEIIASVPQETRRLPQWRDLILYLVIGVGGYLAASLTLAWLLKPTEMTLPLTIAALLLNIVFLSGAVLIVSAWRKSLDLRAIGFFPPRVTQREMNTAILVSLAILPLRGVAAAVVQQIAGGQLDSMARRLELLAPDGFTWLGFFITLVGVGILVPIAEELFFRGAIFTWFRQRFNFPIALVVSSTLFGLAHIDTAGVVASSFVFGLFAAYMFERTKTLWVPIVMHMTSNILAVSFVYLALAVAPEALK